jgi:hypothetical protein
MHYVCLQYDEKLLLFLVTKPLNYVRSQIFRPKIYSKTDSHRNEKEEKRIEKFCMCKCLTEVNFFESNNYFKYSRLDRMILLSGFRKGSGKIDFILIP